MKKDGVSDDCIDDHGYGKKKQGKECIDSILYIFEESDDDEGTIKLTLIVDQFAIHRILIIIKHFLLL